MPVFNFFFRDKIFKVRICFCPSHVHCFVSCPELAKHENTSVKDKNKGMLGMLIINQAQ